MKLLSGSCARLACVALVGLIVGCATLLRTPKARLRAAQSAVASWSGSSRLSAAMMIDKYGPPDRVEAGRLVWNDKALCTELIAWNVEPPAGAGGGDIESTVAYPVPPEKRKALVEFSSLLRVSVNGTELSARSASPNLNFLLLNLAHEVIQGIKTPAQARDFLSTAGKTSPYMQGLLFPPDPTKRGPYPVRF